MSFVKSNFDVFTKSVRDFSADEVATMTTEQFDALTLSDQISIYNNHRAEYDRLTGHTAPSTEDTRTDAEKFCDTFERRVDRAITHTFHGEPQ